MTKVVVFDLYGTIIEQGLEKSPSKQVKKMLGISKSFQEFIETFQKDFMTLRHNTLEDAFRLVAEDFDVNPDQETFDALVGLWNKNALLSHLYEDTEPVLDELSATHRIILTANVSEFTFEQIDIKFDLRERFDDTYLSFETGVLKTSKENLDALLLEEDVDAEEVLYVGDSLKSDIYPARDHGLHTVLVDRRETREFEPKITTLEDLHIYI